VKVHYRTHNSPPLDPILSQISPPPPPVFLEGKKVKITLERATKAQIGSRCIALLFLQPLRSVGVGGQRHAPAALPPGKIRYPLYRGLGGPWGRSGRVRKMSPPTGIRSLDRPARLRYHYPYCDLEEQF